MLIESLSWEIIIVAQTPVTVSSEVRVARTDVAERNWKFKVAVSNVCVFDGFIDNYLPPPDAGPVCRWGYLDVGRTHFLDPSSLRDPCSLRKTQPQRRCLCHVGSQRRHCMEDHLGNLGNAPDQLYRILFPLRRRWQPQDRAAIQNNDIFVDFFGESTTFLLPK